MIEATYGVKNADMEEAKDWVSGATGLTPVAREGYFTGGEYFSFESEGLTGDVLLRNNVDFDEVDQDFIAYIEYREWPLLIVLDIPSTESSVVAQLDKFPNKFKRLALETFNDDDEQVLSE